MSPPRRRAAALGLGLVLAAWSAAPGCSGGNTLTTSASGSNASGSSSGAGGFLGLGGAGGAAEHVACEVCLATTCKAEETACGVECRSLQACLDAVCVNLSANLAADEGACQVYCQGLHPDGVAAHHALVDCAHTMTCQPPCAAYAFDYDQCVLTRNAGACMMALAACTDSVECQAYQTCATGCTTLQACQGCAAVTGGAAGLALYEAYELCIEDACFAEGWVL